jgi:alkanesulfonate monooxygenase SsuD/methylene tetrahydromethanopterin reductase-like flavin-dependent oxidoreductase (luciferase family)
MGPVVRDASQDLRQIDACIELAIQCAESGFSMVTFGEQHFNNYEPYSNPFLMGARIAEHLGDTWFGTTIVPLPFHNPLRLAEDSNVLDLLLRGRFIMGVSAGRNGPFPDFTNFGLAQSERTEIFASKLDILQRAASLKAGEPPLVMDTKWDKGALTGRMMPLSWRRGGAQIAVGTNTDSSIEDAASRGLPLFLGPCSMAEAKSKFALHQAALERAGLDAAARHELAWKSLVTRHVVVGDTEEEAWDSAEALVGRNPMIDRKEDKRSLREMALVAAEDVATDPYPRNAAWVNAWLIAGTPESVASQLRAYEDAGIPHINIRFNPGSADPRIVEHSFSLFLDGVLREVDLQQFPAVGIDAVEPAHLEH